VEKKEINMKNSFEIWHNVPCREIVDVLARIIVYMSVLLIPPPAPAEVYYLGGNDPGTGTWKSGTWSNFVELVNNLTDGDELRIAGTIERQGPGTGGYYVTNAANNTKITGGWDGKTGGWSRLDISKRENRWVIDGCQHTNLLLITGTNVTLEGLVLKRGAFTFAEINGANLKILATAPESRNRVRVHFKRRYG
jgi:hypothetical protein